MESLLPSPGCHGARRPTLPAAIPAGVSAAGDPGSGRGTSVTIGPANAPHAVVIWEDFLCPYCGELEKQTHEQLTQLASGEIKSVIVQSTYMHGQGLMVPVFGKLTAVPGEDGLPVHLLLEAEDRHQTH